MSLLKGEIRSIPTPAAKCLAFAPLNGIWTQFAWVFPTHVVLLRLFGPHRGIAQVFPLKEPLSPQGPVTIIDFAHMAEGKEGPRRALGLYDHTSGLICKITLPLHEKEPGPLGHFGFERDAGWLPSDRSFLTDFRYRHPVHGRLGDFGDRPAAREVFHVQTGNGSRLVSLLRDEGKLRLARRAPGQPFWTKIRPIEWAVPKWVLEDYILWDVHPTTAEMAVFLHKEGIYVRFFYRGEDVGILSTTESTWSWTRLGGALRTIQGMVFAFNPTQGSFYARLERPRENATHVVEDAWGHLWGIRREGHIVSLTNTLARP